MRIFSLHKLQKVTSRWLLTITVLLSLFSSSGTTAGSSAVKSASVNTELFICANVQQKGTISYTRFTSSFPKNPVVIFFPFNFEWMVLARNRTVINNKPEDSKENRPGINHLHQKIPSTPEEGIPFHKG